MSKEYLEAFEILLQHIETEADWSDYEKVKNAHKIVEQALQRLEAIDNANPSEALECLECLKSHISARDMLGETNKKIALDICNDIEKALLKAQANARSEEILQKHYEEGITLDSVRALKQERDNYKKILEVIKEKRIDIESFYASFIERDFNYDFYASFYGSYGRNKLTKEEFNLLKGILNDEQ